METLKMLMPLIEDWCGEVGANFLVLTVFPDHVTITDGVRMHTFRKVIVPAQSQ